MECGIDVTRALKVGQWGAKGVALRITGSYRGGNLSARKEPDFNVLRSPFHGIYTTPNIIESVSKGSCRPINDTTSRTVVFRTVRGVNCSCHVIFRNRTLAPCVKCHVICCLVVDTFNNVDFAIGWPVCTVRPESWPDTACTARHMCQVRYEKALGKFKVRFHPS